MRYTTSTDHQCPACGYIERKSKKRASDTVEFITAASTVAPVTVETYARITDTPVIPEYLVCLDCMKPCGSAAGLSAHRRFKHKQAAEV